MAVLNSIQAFFKILLYFSLPYMQCQIAYGMLQIYFQNFI